LYKWIPPFAAALCLHLQGGYRCGKLYGQVTKKVHMMWGVGPVEVVHGKCVADRKWLSSGLKIVVTRGSWKHEEKGKAKREDRPFLVFVSPVAVKEVVTALILYVNFPCPLEM
jgi:hypothetical protein